MMNKKIWITAVLLIVVVGLGIYALAGRRSGAVPEATPIVVSDPLNTTYMIEGQPVTLVNGRAEMDAAPGSATKVTTSVFGTPVSGDLNADGKADSAVILVQNPGGSGTFYYVAAAISKDGGVEGSNAVLLGDRISPQTVEIKNGQIVANYADRKPGEPMTTQPSVGVTKYLIYQNSTLSEVTPIVVATTTISTAADPGEHCGGNMTTARVCQAGYHCAPVPGSHLPFGDVGGTCVKN